MEGLKLSLKYPNNRGFMCRKVFNDFRKTTMMTFFKFVPSELIKDYNKADALVELINGSTIQFGDLESENKIKSMDLGWFAIDECSDATYEDFKMLTTRLRLSSQKPIDRWTREEEYIDGKLIIKYIPRYCGILATNPEPCWVKDLFIDHQNPITGKPLNVPERYSFTQSLPSDNPYNPNDYVQSLREDNDPEWVQKYVEGHWTTFKGLVYKEFSKEKHVKDFDIDWRWNFYRSVDFGVSDPNVCLYIGVDTRGRWWIFDEYYSVNDTISTKEHVEEILTKYPKTEYYFRGSVADSHGLGKQLIIDARRYGLPLMELKQHRISEGVDRVKHQLRLIDGEPIMIVHPRCVNLIREFGRWQHIKPNSDNSDSRERYQDRDNHALDSLKNFAMTYYGMKPLSKEAKEYRREQRSKIQVSSITGF